MPIDRRNLLIGAGAIGAAAAFGPRAVAQPRVKVIDVHTHMYSNGWVEAVEDANDPTFRIGPNGALIYREGSIGRMTPPMLDWDLRIKDMDAAHVDVALISLTAPNVYWGTRAQSAAAARSMLGRGQSYDEVHWFWSDQYDANIQYAGFHVPWDQLIVRGSLAERKFLAFFLTAGRVESAVAINQGRDLRRAFPLIKARVPVDPARLADPQVDLRTLVPAEKPA